MVNGNGTYDALGVRGGTFRALAENLEQCVCAQDAEGHYFFANRALLDWLGRSESEVLGATDDVLWPPDLAAALAADRARVLAGEQLEGEERRPRGGGLQLVRTRKLPLRDERGAVVGMLVRFHAASATPPTPEAGRYALRMELVGRLASGVAHDFNNFLTILQGHATLLDQALGPVTPHHEHVACIRQAAREAAGLASQLLALARKESRKKQPVQLNDVVLNVTGLLARTFDRRIEVAARPAAGLATVLAEPTQMTQLLMNLCLNARDAMPQGGRLVVETATVSQAAGAAGLAPGSYVQLRVSDTGPGIPPEAQAHIFEPSFTTKNGGTGLGLDVVQTIVREHGGRIECVSAVGRGTSFEVYLPAAAQAAAPAVETPPASGTPPPATEKRTVLFADDEWYIRRLAQSVLESAGYRVLLAENGRKALDLCRQDPDAIALVVLDQTMPGLTGAEMVAALGTAHADVPILLISGYSEKDLPEGTLQQLAGFLPKPFFPDQLLEAVRAALKQGTMVRGQRSEVEDQRPAARSQRSESGSL